MNPTPRSTSVSLVEISNAQPRRLCYDNSARGIRLAAAVVGLAFVALFLLNTFGQSPASIARASEYFSKEEIEKGLRFSQDRKLLFWIGNALQLALLTTLVCSTWARRATDVFNRWTGQRWPITLLLVAGTYFAINEAITLPLGLASLKQAQAWHMTTREVGPWLVDWLKQLAVTAVEWLVVIFGLYGLIYLSPRRWWLWAGLGAAALGVTYALVMPEVIQPLFNKFTPLNDPYLQKSIAALANKAGVVVSDVEVMDASTQGRHTNAYFVGFGPTRRVVLYDTLIAAHSGINRESVASLAGLAGSDMGPLAAASQLMAAHTAGEDEMETILGHEIGHWQHDHIAKGLLLASIVGLVGFYLLSHILRRAVGRRPFCLTGITDPAGLPLLVLLATLGHWLTLPLQNTISREFERQADVAALELADKPDAFIDAEKRLARDNLSNVAPTNFSAWMFSTHPPPVQRIEMAEQWKKRK